MHGNKFNGEDSQGVLQGLKYSITFIELTLEKFDQWFRVFPPFAVVLDNVSELAQSTVEGREVRLVVHGRLVHMIEDLLYDPGEHELRESFKIYVTTDPHRRNLAVCCKCVLRLADGEVEQGE